MSKHTPGPWTFYADVPSTEPNWHIVTNASRMRVLANVHITPGNEMDLANAHLISAAPDLLDDLVEAAATLRRYEALHRAKNTDESTAKAEVNAALATRFEVTIAKARGET